EHVGVENYRTYFKKIKSLMKKDAVALVHFIGRLDVPGEPDGWMLKYIFPGGYVPAFSEVVPAIEKAKLYTTDIEIWRYHYVETLHAWLVKFFESREEIKNMFDEKFCRMWEFFLIAAEMEFRYGRMGVFQVQMSRELLSVPLTR